jgi:two-component system, OmpR family, phosphate regulon sensor histidine kinase PhoR
MIKGTQVRLLIFLGIIAIAGIILVQWYWLKMAFDRKEQEFQHSVQISLHEVAQNLAKTYNTPLQGEVVKKVTDDYFVVNVNTNIHSAVLEDNLRKTFQRYNLKTDFEYAIFDCDKNNMVYGNYVSFNNVGSTNTNRYLPRYEGLLYYFGIRFPEKISYYTRSLNIWLIFCGILLVALSFFGYALHIILQQRRQNIMQRDFVNNMTHEFKTPLSSIKVATEFLQSQPHQDTRGQKYLEVIQNQNTRLNKLVESVLQNARAEKKEFALDRQLTDPADLLREITNHVQMAHAGEATISFEHKGGPKQYLIDEIHFTNIIETMVDNAIKYCDKEPEIVISCIHQPNFTFITLKDNGIGIEKKYLKSRLTKFFRVPTGNVHNRKGYGLGLFYVKNIVEKHGWKIRVDSALNEGTKFIITIK